MKKKIMTMLYALLLALMFTLLAFPFGLSPKDWGDGPIPPGGNVYVVTLFWQPVYESPLTLASAPYYLLVYACNFGVAYVILAVLMQQFGGKEGDK